MNKKKLKQTKLDIYLFEINEKYNLNSNEFIDELFKNAELTNAELSLFNRYAFECDSCYSKLALTLNSSKYIAKKEIKRIRLKIIEANKKYIQ